MLLFSELDVNVFEISIYSRAVLLGQSISVIDSIESVSDIINDIVSEAEILLKKAASNIK